MTDADARAMLAGLVREVEARLAEMGHAYPEVVDDDIGDLIDGDRVLQHIALRISMVEAAAKRAGLGPYGVHAYLWPPGPRGRPH
jgi:hypothetical protein